MRKLKFYLIGLIPGFIIVFFVLNQKGVSCSGYLPNSRVITETLSKEFSYSEEFKVQMQHLQITESFLKDSLITHGEINFQKSNAQKKPCPSYLLYYPKKNPMYEISFEKCEKEARFFNLKSLK